MADDDEDFLMQTYNGGRNDDESCLYSPQLDEAWEGEGNGNAHPTLPPGTHVQLEPDEGRVKRVQGEHWDKEVMERIAGCTGTVIRHSGDVALVQFLVEDTKLCTSIFRVLLAPVCPEEDEMEDPAVAPPAAPRPEKEEPPTFLVGSQSTNNSGYSIKEPPAQLVRRRSRRDSMVSNLILSASVNPAMLRLLDLTEADKRLIELFELGNTRFRERNFSAAVAAFSEALAAATAPGTALSDSRGEVIPVHAILSNRSGAYLAAADWEHAFEDAAATISVKPGSTKGYVRAGNVHRALRQFQEARKMYSAALKLDPNNVEIQYLLRTAHVSEVYHRLPHLKRLHITWCRAQQMSIQCKVPLEPPEQLFCEPPLFAVGCSVEGERRYCDYCCRTLIDDQAKATIPASLQPALRQLLEHRETTVPCPNPGCNACFCCERCRDRALVSFHALECRGSGGRWASIASGPATAELPEYEKGLLRLAFRIVSTAVARIRAERPSNHDGLFLQLFPVGEMSRVLSQQFNASAAAIYRELCSLMTTYERGVVTQEHWDRVVNVTAANAKFTTCSPWNELAVTQREICNGTDLGQHELAVFLKSDEAVCCVSHAMALFPTLPHFQRTLSPNTKLHVSGCWKPTLVGVLLKPVSPGEVVTVMEVSEPYTGDARNVSINTMSSLGMPSTNSTPRTVTDTTMTSQMDELVAKSEAKSVRAVAQSLALAADPQ